MRRPYRNPVVGFAIFVLLFPWLIVGCLRYADWVIGVVLGLRQ